MNVRLTYHSGQTYSEAFSEFKVLVWGGGKKRIRVSFTDKNFERSLTAFSLPVDKGQQLAHAILTAASGVQEPIIFDVDDQPKADASQS